MSRINGGLFYMCVRPLTSAIYIPDKSRRIYVHKFFFDGVTFQRLKWANYRRRRGLLYALILSHWVGWLPLPNFWLLMDGKIHYRWLFLDINMQLVLATWARVQAQPIGLFHLLAPVPPKLIYLVFLAYLFLHMHVHFCQLVSIMSTLILTSYHHWCANG